MTPNDHRQADRERTLRRQKEAREHRENVRRFALEDLATGMSVTSVAATWGVDRDTLASWVDQAGGV
jgi:hypothetical protein